MQRAARNIPIPQAATPARQCRIHAGLHAQIGIIGFFHPPRLPEKGQGHAACDKQRDQQQHAHRPAAFAPALQGGGHGLQGHAQSAVRADAARHGQCFGTIWQNKSPHTRILGHDRHGLGLPEIAGERLAFAKISRQACNDLPLFIGNDDLHALIDFGFRHNALQLCTGFEGINPVV